MRIKIMYVISTLQKAGPTNQLFNLLSFIDKNIFDPIIVTLSPEPPDSSYNLFKELDIKVESLNHSRIKGFFLTKIDLNNLVDKYKPSIIQTHGFRADRIKINFRIPKVIILRTSINQPKPLQIKPNFLGKFFASLLYKYHLSYVKKFEFVFTCSKCLSSEINEILGVNFRYIQNGVNIHRYFPVSEKTKNKIRNKLAIPIDKKIFLSVGSLIPEKNTGAIIELFLCCDFLKNSQLIVLGNGIEYNKYKKKTNNYDNIRLLGDTQNVKEYLQASDYFISASRGEGLSNSVLEAMSTGIPCILSNIPSHREIMDNSQLGVLFALDDSNDLILKIIQIINMNYNSLSKNCRNHIINFFSAKRMSFDYQQLYKEILND